MLRRWTGRQLPTWYHAHYRLPLTSVAARTELEPRRADLAVWYLLHVGALSPDELRKPARISYRDLRRVHTDEWLENLTHTASLASVFSVDPWDLPLEETIRSVRLICGGTLAAAREALARQGPTYNTLGGMHHAGRAFGGGFCPVNDIAVAIAALRSEGELGQVVVLDLDAHPPDGTADCLVDDADSWIGSISGADWGPLAGDVDEVRLPPETGDADYLSALEGLLSRMPRPKLAFVLAGGDVLGRDPVGPLGLTEDGAKRRDLRVARALDGVATVWVPAGGYGALGWRVMAHTVMALNFGPRSHIPDDIDPLRLQFSRLSRSIRKEELGGEDEWLTEEDLAESLGLPPRKPRRLLGFYTTEGIEHAYARFGILDQLARLGYRHFRADIDRVDVGERVRMLADGPDGVGEMTLVESVLERRPVPGAEDAQMLFVHWLTLRHPLAMRDADRPLLPGQEVPGLGMAREAGQMFARMARRLDLQAVGVRPAWFHVAYASRYRFRFSDPARQGRFEALIRDVAHVPLRDVTVAVAEGRVLLNGEPYAWEPDEMLFWLDDDHQSGDAAEVDAARSGARFTVVAAQTALMVRPPSK